MNESITFCTECSSYYKAENFHSCNIVVDYDLATRTSTFICAHCGERYKQYDTGDYRHINAHNYTQDEVACLICGNLTSNSRVCEECESHTIPSMSNIAGVLQYSDSFTLICPHCDEVRHQSHIHLCTDGKWHLSNGNLYHIEAGDWIRKRRCQNCNKLFYLGSKTLCSSCQRRVDLAYE